jgi:hydroxylamine reductase
MFCYQCEQTAKGTGCTVQGVCGKDSETATIQDLLLYSLKGLGMVASRARKLGVKDREVDVFTIKALFSTLTNVNFDATELAHWVRRSVQLREKIKVEYTEACRRDGRKPEILNGPASWQPGEEMSDLVSQGKEIGIMKRMEKLGPDATGLEELLTYGLKGLAAYADHAQILGQEDDLVYGYLEDTLSYLAGLPADVNDLFSQCMKCGEMNLKVMELLDRGNTGAYGQPEPTQVRITPKKGKAILVSGHDLKDLAELLKQTEGMGINVYTHGEMLPANAYPGLKKYSHLAGNYGGAWQDQRKEFDEFPGAILMTTNCIQRPQESYKGRIFTSGVVGWPGVRHLDDANFGPVIEAAMAAEGFTEDSPEKTITIGFGHHAVMGVADQVISAVKSGEIRHFFLVGGCDGAKPGRNYYTEFAQKVPKDCVILTLACGKYRFNKLEFGTIGGIPRLLDIGQCNDAYSAIQIAVSLAKAFNTDVNHLPLSMILSWFEQKAVVILLTLLYLGIQNIRLGPSLPAFVTPAVLKVLVDKFNIKPISTADEDLKAILGEGYLCESCKA